MKTARVLGAATLAGAGALAYGVGYERNAFTLRRLDVPVLSRGTSPLRVLHLSDLHMLDRQRAKQEWIKDLGRLLPDLVVLTGDVLSAGDAGSVGAPSARAAARPAGHLRPGQQRLLRADVQKPHPLRHRQPQRFEGQARSTGTVSPASSSRPAGRT